MYALDEKTRLGLAQFKEQVARLNGAEDFSSTIEVKPAIQQVMIDRYKEQTDFLGKINIVQVKEASGEKLGLGNDTPVASTTDTRIQPRRPTEIGDVEHVDDYLCTQTDYDIAYNWKKIDNWSNQPNFLERLKNFGLKQVAQDKQRIGFNGTHRAKTSNKTLYPKLQDVNIGWLEKIRTFNQERYLKSITVGSGHEFKNLDALVAMLINDMIAEQFRENDDLVVIAARNLVNDKFENLINQKLAPTETAAAKALYKTKELGNLPVDTPAFFLPGGLMITSYDNLSIYQQKGSVRRFIKDEPEWNRTSDYQSANECYVVEDYDKCVLIDEVILEP